MDGLINNWSDRYNHLSKVLVRPSPFLQPNFQPGREVLEFVQNICKVLVIGAGGLGCELLKDLALLGFMNIDVIDMDIIDLSNLNRQFLFRHSDIGKSKAETAAAFINLRVAGCNVKAHFAKIQDFDVDFYREFHIIVCGLDSIEARRWINGLLVGMLNFDADGSLEMDSVIPLVDGGTEGFKGNARVIMPGLTACIECTLDLYPPKVNFPLCTIAHTPRLAEHCIEYVRILLWPKENPFGENEPIDGDNPEHVQWILEKSADRANQFNISGVNYRLTQGVIKNIIPAVASTNAVVAAVSATEVFKIATSCFSAINNYFIFNDVDGVYTHTFESERKENCIVCSSHPVVITFSQSSTLQDIINYLQNDRSYQFKSPGVVTQVSGKNRTLYMSTVASIEAATKQNLKLSIKELELHDGQILHVADPTAPNNLTFILKYSD